MLRTGREIGAVTFQNHPKVTSLAILNETINGRILSFSLTYIKGHDIHLGSHGLRMK